MRQHYETDLSKLHELLESEGIYRKHPAVEEEVYDGEIPERFATPQEVLAYLRNNTPQK